MKGMTGRAQKQAGRSRMGRMCLEHPMYLKCISHRNRIRKSTIFAHNNRDSKSVPAH